MSQNQGATLEGPMVREMVSIIWEVGGLGDESELGKHFPAPAKLGERSSDVLDSLPDSLLKEFH